MKLKSSIDTCILAEYISHIEEFCTPGAFLGKWRFQKITKSLSNVSWKNFLWIFGTFPLCKIIINDHSQMLISIFHSLCWVLGSDLCRDQQETQVSQSVWSWTGVEGWKVFQRWVHRQVLDHHCAGNHWTHPRLLQINHHALLAFYRTIFQISELVLLKIHFVRS